MDQPNVGLGCRLAPNGSQLHENIFQEQQCQKFHAKLKTAALSADKAYQYLLTRIVPSVCYASALTNIPDKTCKKMNTLIDTAVMPKLGLNCHMPKAVLYGPLSCRGLSCSHFKSIQTTQSMTNMIK